MFKSCPPFWWPPDMEQDQEMDDAPQRIWCSLVQTCNTFLLDQSTPVLIFKKDVIKGLFSAFSFCKGCNQGCTKGFVQKIIITVGSLLCASGWSCTRSVNGDPQECQQPGWTDYYLHKTVCKNHHSFCNSPFCRTMFSKVDKVG